MKRTPIVTKAEKRNCQLIDNELKDESCLGNLLSFLRQVVEARNEYTVRNWVSDL